MKATLISSQLGDKFESALNRSKQLQIISPFVGGPTGGRLATSMKARDLSLILITRFVRFEFAVGVSNLPALRELIEAGAKVYALKHLHTKLYLFDSHTAIVGSSNFTWGGFYKNHELSIEVTDKAFVGVCSDYFSRLENDIRKDGNGEVTLDWIDSEAKAIEKISRRMIRKMRQATGHQKGANLGQTKGMDQLDRYYSRGGWKGPSRPWLKLEGKSRKRIDPTRIYRKDNRRDHDRTYFSQKPGGIHNGDELFIAALSTDKNGSKTPIVVGMAMTHGMDSLKEASATEKKRHERHKDYPFSVNLLNLRLIDTPVVNGITMEEVYNAIGNSAFPRLASKKDAGFKKFKRSYRQKSHMKITKEAAKYLRKRLESLFRKHGVVKI